MSRKLTPNRYEQIKRLGAELIEDYELAYPLDPFEIAEVLGVRIVIHVDGLPKEATWYGTNDGYTEVVEGSHGLRFIVHVNGKQAPARQRFTIMHEIAHIWLDHLNAAAGHGDDAREGEANFLAAYVLAPDALVVKWVPDLTEERIVEVFCVSLETAQLAHARVRRAHTVNALGKPHDLRITAVARRRPDESDQHQLAGMWR